MYSELPDESALCDKFAKKGPGLRRGIGSRCRWPDDSKRHSLMAAAAIRHRPYDIVICEPINTDKRLINRASRGMLPELNCSAQLSTNTKSRALDNITSHGQNTLPPRLVHAPDSIRCQQTGYLSRLPSPNLLVIVPCRPSRVCVSRPSN